MKLFLFQPLDHELIGMSGCFEQSNFLVELAMLGTQLGELLPDVPVVQARHHFVSHPSSAICAHTPRVVKILLSKTPLQRKQEAQDRSTNPGQIPDVTLASQCSRMNNQAPRKYWTSGRKSVTLERFLQLSMEDRMARSSHLSELAEKHKLLDRRIAEEQSRPALDEVKVNRLKLQKLRLKDEITKLQQPSP